jgi:DNA-binding transcriptional ArsR family regulator
MSETTQTTKPDIVESSNQPDYAAISPAANPPTEYTYPERRAEILQQTRDLGHPSALNQTELAERYDVSQQQISKDLDRLDEYVRGRLGQRRDLEIGTVLEKCMTGALEEGDYTSARKAAMAYDDYLDRRLDTLEFRQRIQRLENLAGEDE